MVPNLQLSLIAAMAEKTHIIGKNGGLPWHIPSDLARFKQITREIGIIIMGRTTYESILAQNGGRPLPGRTHIVMTTGVVPTQQGPQVFWAQSVEQALALAAHFGKEACVIGGAAIYRLFAPLVEILYLTMVHGDVQGDICFPGSFYCVEGYAWRHIDSRNSRRRWNPSDEYPTSFHILKKICV